jgi:hypothetical protein
MGEQTWILGGGFGWGKEISGFGAWEKRRLSPSRQGGGVDGGSPEVGSDQYLCSTRAPLQRKKNVQF